MIHRLLPVGLALALALGLVAAILGPLPAAAAGPADSPAPLAAESLADGAVLVRGPSRAGANPGLALKGFAVALAVAFCSMLFLPTLASVVVERLPNRRSAGADWFPLRC